ncbi:response regulator [Fulvivirga lutea]|uniref:Response regulator transcription factor n=1 Tax=Fulvivirga lutea TaxID=2810512 RepID=A0A975A167_9BACT|nr:response regulator transcription factor [Fulvivirga lutea]QSE97915.1 response regulator transcription factor [Fulvivirga lutea]
MRFLKYFPSVNRSLAIMYNLLLVDDHTLVLDGLESLISKNEDMQVIAKVNTIAECLNQLKKNEIHLIITDYSLEEEDGLTLVRKVKLLDKEVKIIVLSMHDEAHLVKEILKEGINGYVLKKNSHKELLNAITAVRNDQIYLSNEINQLLINNLHSDENKLLTPREREIVVLISKEYTNRQIAEELFISERTVETHRKNIFRKTDTNNLVGLLKYAYANNLI